METLKTLRDVVPLLDDLIKAENKKLEYTGIDTPAVLNERALTYIVKAITCYFFDINAEIDSYDLAKKDLEKAIELAPENADYKRNLAFAEKYDLPE
jgi:hypothetical protein